MAVRVRAVRGDITKLAVDVIVNAANSSLLGGGGVDGAIHRAAGPELVHACRLLGGCKTGQSKITKGFCLPAKYVVHTVGPVWRGGEHGERDLLECCYASSLGVAASVSAVSVAFPGISTGIFKYPIELAASIAVSTVLGCLPKFVVIQEVIFCCFSDEDLMVYEQILSAVMA